MRSRLAFGLRGASVSDWVLLRGHTELIVDSVVPDLLHVIPIDGNAVLSDGGVSALGGRKGGVSALMAAGREDAMT